MAKPAWLLAFGLVLTVSTAPGLAVPTSPVRWNTGGAVWTTSAKALNTFLSTGQITDRGLEDGLNGSGWTSQQI